MADTAARLLRLLGLLQARPDWSGAELAARLEITDRSVRRDIERLRSLGYPVESTHGHGGGYRLASGRSLPPLVFDDASAVAVAVALRMAAGTGIDGLGEDALRAMAVLDQVMPAHLREVVAALSGTTSVLPRGRDRVSADVLLGLAQAARRHVRVRFGYSDKTGAASERSAEPYHVVSLNQRWYLMAFDLDRDDWRTFRLDRLVDGTLHQTTFTFRPREAPDPAEYVRQSVFGGADSAKSARIRIHMPAEQLRHMISEGAGTITADGGFCSILTTRSDDLEWIAFRLTSFTVPVEVLEPDELRATMTRMADRLAAAAGTQLP